MSTLLHNKHDIVLTTHKHYTVHCFYTYNHLMPKLFCTLHVEPQGLGTRLLHKPQEFSAIHHSHHHCLVGD